MESMFVVQHALNTITPYFYIEDVMTGAACGAETADLIPPLIYIEVHVFLSFVSLCFV